MNNPTVTAIGKWKTNAELVAHGLYPLGYISDEMSVLDVTYGLGRFWTIRCPRLTACDIDPDRSPYGEPVDFTDLPFEDNSFDATVIDPPYKLNGKSTGKGVGASDEAYGVAGDYVPWRERHKTIRAGLTEAIRVTRAGGHVLLKCQDQVSSGKVRWQTIEFTNHAHDSGAQLVDMLHLTGGRPQPANRRQLHARRNYSTMLIFRT